MKRGVLCVTAQTTVTEAAALMRDAGVGFLPVCNEERTAIGTLTDRDIAVRVVAESDSADQPVERFMTPNVVACRPDDDLTVALDLMAEMQVSRIICLADKGQLEGIISLSDVAQVADGLSAADTLRSVTIREARP